MFPTIYFTVPRNSCPSPPPPPPSPSCHGGRPEKGGWGGARCTTAHCFVVAQFDNTQYSKVFISSTPRCPLWYSFDEESCEARPLPRPPSAAGGVRSQKQYHPVTGEPVFMRMIIEDEDGRALKFRTRTRAEYARVRPGMLAEAVLVGFWMPKFCGNGILKLPPPPCFVLRSLVALGRGEFGLPLCIGTPRWSDFKGKKVSVRPSGRVI